MLVGVDQDDVGSTKVHAYFAKLLVGTAIQSIPCDIGVVLPSRAFGA
ncbi:MAG: hypothetical protein OXG15_08795 [Gammaproteobacteria bacterium]|nr:hypothetical protein [Gammaproteobacteria bacterium]